MAEVKISINLPANELKKYVKTWHDDILLKAVETYKDNAEYCEILMQEYDRRHQKPCDGCRM